MKSVGVAVVNYRTADLIVDLLASLKDGIGNEIRLDIVLVDNDSGDDSVDILQSAISELPSSIRAEIILAERNGGFSYGNNIAFGKLLDRGCDYVWLLNPDTRILPGAAEALISCLDGGDTIGIAGSHLQDADGTAQIASFNFPTPSGEFVNTCGVGFIRRMFPSGVVARGVPESQSRVDWVAGASFMIKAEVLRTVGIMDESYFLYFEEVDFCLVCSRLGYSTYFVPESKVIHLVGGATGISDTRKKAPRRPTYWFASRRRYFQKNFGYACALWADIMWVTGYCVQLLKKKMRNDDNLDPPNFVRDFLANSSWIKGRIPNSKSSDVTKVDEYPNLWRLIKEDWIANGRDWTRPGFRALAVYRFGVWRMSIRRKVFRAPLSVIYRMLFRRARNVYGIEFPYSIQAGRSIVIEHQGGIVVHGAAVIGDGCIIRQGVTIGNKDLKNPFLAPKLGKRVNVGAGAKILGDIEIGDDVTIGANAVVLSSVPAGSLMVGIPARRVR